MELEQLKAMFDKEFAPPFLPEGMVSCEIRALDNGPRELFLRIGRRDVVLNEAGETVGAGTMLSHPVADVEEETLLGEEDESSCGC